MPVRYLLRGAVPWTMGLLMMLRGAAGLDNGLAITPPMGWRSWNCFHGDVSAAKIESIIDALSDKARTVDGIPTSLADLGYTHVGVDDGWQACKQGKDCSFHAEDGTPLVNSTTFPDLRALVQHGNARGVLVGWYQINCICCDEFTDQGNLTWKRLVYEADAKQLRDAGFHGVKLDDCGDGTGAGMLQRVAAINASGKPLLIENSNQGVGGPGATPHNGRDNPVTADAPCPFNLFRTGGDIVPDFGVVIDKLQRAVPYLGNATFAPISRPGCWAYPDMLEVGNFASSPTAFAESRTHFGAWCIVSSPLILGLDLTNAATVDAVWAIISNKEAITVNQQWAGQPGRLVTSTAGYQVWSKQLPKGEMAVLAFNRGTAPINISVAATVVAPWLTDGSPARNIWNRTDADGVISGGALVATLGAHDSVFYRFSPPSARAPADGRRPWWPRAVAATAADQIAPRPAPVAALAACRRVHGAGAGAGACSALTTCEQRCTAAGHCCTGSTSGYQHPSCAQGCTVARGTASVAACKAVCAAADDKCSWAFNGTQMSNCGSCPSTCCNAVVVGECAQGCEFGF